VTDGPVERFLAELERRLGRDDEARRRIVSEVGDHLRDLAAEARARGLGEHDAELEAVDRFGSPRELARGLRPGRRLAVPAWVLGGTVVAGCFAALAVTLAGHGTRSPQIPVQAARSAVLVSNSLPDLCMAAIARERLRAEGSGRVSEIVIDPRTGGVISWGYTDGYAAGPICHLRPANSPASGLLYAPPDPAAPFG
jgi:hypothetical protein